MRDLLWRVRFRRKLRPHHVTGDTTYGTVENIVAVEDARHPSLRPAARLRRTARRSSASTPSPTTPSATCTAAPEARSLRFRTHKHTDRVRVYQAPAPRLQRLSAQGRVHGQHQRAAGRRGASTRRTSSGSAATTRPRPTTKAMRKRQVWVEPLFAEAKALARAAAVPPPGADERQHRRAAGRGRPEPQAVLGRDRVGAAPRPVREPGGPPRVAPPARNHLNVTDVSADNGGPPIGCTETPSGFFNRLSIPTATLTLPPSDRAVEDALATGRWRARAGTACRRSPTCRTPSASRATRPRSAPPRGCRRARCGGRGAAAPWLASAAGAPARRGATRRR